MEKYVGLIEGVEVVRGTYEECLETIGIWNDFEGFTLCGDRAIIPA